MIISVVCRRTFERGCGNRDSAIGRTVIDEPKYPHSSYLILVPDFGCEFIVPIPCAYTNILRFVDIRMWTGNNEFASDIRHSYINGNGPKTPNESVAATACKLSILVDLNV